MVTTDLFLIDGLPMLAPDGDVEVRYEDIDAAAAGRDESGVMHRLPVRQNVTSWGFTYSVLTQQEKDYLDSLFSGKATFSFTCGGKTRVCYRSGVTVSWQNAKTGLWRGYGFTVIEC